MADLELRDANGNVMVSFVRMPSYPWAQYYEPNAVVGASLGGYVRSSRRGPSLLVNRLTWRNLEALAASQILNALRDCAGGAQPVLLHLGALFEQVADDTRVADGTLYAAGDFRCRLFNRVEVEEHDYTKVRLTLECVQDLVEV